MGTEQLYVVYDKQCIREDSVIYLKQIKKRLQNIIEITVENICEIPEQASYLYLKSTSKKRDEEIKNYLKNKNLNNIEFDKDGISITAEAILKVLKQFGNIKDKLITIVNQSEEVGKSLAIYLIKNGYNVASINSKINKSAIENISLSTNILILAAENFRYKQDELCEPQIVIDISNSTDNDILAIKYIPTIEVLKKRI